MLIKFITALAWTFLCVFLLRVFSVLFCNRNPEELRAIQLLKIYGNDPIADALRIPFIGIIICIVWLCVKYF